MKRILFIILVISLIFAACSNSVNNNAIKPPKAGNSVLPNLVETTSPSTEINAPNEGNASSNELNEILNEADQALGGDVEKMRQTLKSPFVLYQNQEFYTIYDLIKMKPEEISKLGLSQEELLSHTDKVYDAMKSFGYDNEVTQEYFYDLSEKIQSMKKADQ